MLRVRYWARFQRSHRPLRFLASNSRRKQPTYITLHSLHVYPIARRSLCPLPLFTLPFHEPYQSCNPLVVSAGVASTSYNFSMTTRTSYACPFYESYSVRQSGLCSYSRGIRSSTFEDAGSRIHHFGSSLVHLYASLVDVREGSNGTSTEEIKMNL